MAWARVASTHYPYKAAVKFFSGLATVLMLTLTLQVYALQAGAHMHPTMGVLVLFFTPWIGVAGLASAIVVPMVLFVWTAVRARRAQAVSNVPSEAAARTWTINPTELSPEGLFGSGT